MTEVQTNPAAPTRCTLHTCYSRQSLDARGENGDVC